MKDKCTQIFGGKNLKDTDRMVTLGIHGKIILQWILNRFGECGRDLSGSG
jgi:hypothetical protein